jgi:hypothetical protein
MPWVGVDSTIPAFERAKTVHALDRAATVTGLARFTRQESPPELISLDIGWTVSRCLSLREKNNRRHCKTYSYYNNQIREGKYASLQWVQQQL